MLSVYSIQREVYLSNSGMLTEEVTWEENRTSWGRGRLCQGSFDFSSQWASGLGFMWTRSCSGIGWAEAHMHQGRRQGWSRAAGNENTEGRNTLRLCSERQWGRGDFCFVLCFVVHAGNWTAPIPSLRESCAEFPLWKDTFLLQVPGLCFCFLLTRQFNFRKYFLCLCYQSSETWDYQSCVWHLVKYSNNVPSHQNSLVVCFMNWIFHYRSFPSCVHFCIAQGWVSQCNCSLWNHCFLISGSFWII